LAIFITILCVLIALLAGLAIGYIYRKNIQEKKIGRTEEYARNLLDDAQRRAEEKKKESILEAKEEVIRLKNELDREVRDRRAEVQRSERRLAQREETLDKKADNLDARETTLERKQYELDRLTQEAQEYTARQKAAAETAEQTMKELEEKRRVELERVAKMTQDEAALKSIKSHFPQAYKAMEAMAQEMLNNDNDTTGGVPGAGSIGSR
jgi:ribonuclease Y